MHCQDPSDLPPILAHHLRHYASMSAKEAKGKCYMICASIQTWFPHLTVVVGAVEWSGSPTVHCWLEHDGRVIDPTRQQFGSGSVTFWKAKKQDLTAMGFYRQVGDYMAAHPEAKRKEILAALADVVYRDDGLLLSPVWCHFCRQEFASCLCASIGVYLDAGKTCETCGAIEGSSNTATAGPSATLETA